MWWRVVGDEDTKGASHPTEAKPATWPSEHKVTTSNENHLVSRMKLYKIYVPQKRATWHFCLCVRWGYGPWWLPPGQPSATHCLWGRPRVTVCCGLLTGKKKNNLLPVSKKRPLFSHFSLWCRALGHGRRRLLVRLPSCWLQPVWAWEGAGGAMTWPGPPVLALLSHMGTPWAEQGGMAP